MTAFDEKYAALLQAFGPGKPMVLSTAAQGQASSRMMSVICLEGRFFFQTDRRMRKYAQLTANPRVALCADNVQIEGSCRELGHPLEHPAFCEAFRTVYPGSYARYTALTDERVFEVLPARIQRWLYVDGEPFVEVFDVTNAQYQLSRYEGC